MIQGLNDEGEYSYEVEEAHVYGEPDDDPHTKEPRSVIRLLVLRTAAGADDPSDRKKSGEVLRLSRLFAGHFDILFFVAKNARSAPIS